MTNNFHTDKFLNYRFCGKALLIALLAFFAVTVFWNENIKAQSNDTNKIIGKVVDTETGEPLPGVTIRIAGTNMGGISDLNGIFSIARIPLGTYEITVSLLGYAKMRVQSVIVESNSPTSLDIALKPDAISVQDVVVEAEALKNTEASMLKKRQKSYAVSDAISAEAIDRTGSGDAAEAMSKVTGASVIGGKYVYIRGLGERYSNTQLNGAELPSADPDKKAFQMDLLPSNLLENIVTIKSFTPDQPGSFSGGIIDIGTKTYPDKFTLTFSTSSAYHRGTTSDDNFLTYSGGSKDWLGMDDGSRDIPSELYEGVQIPDIGSTYRDTARAHELERLSRSFNNTMGPTTKTAPLNRNFALSLGNQINLLGRPFGYLGSFTYSRNFSSYENGEFEKWRLTGTVENSDSLAMLIKLKDSQSTEEVIWGGMAMTSYKPHPYHELAVNFLYTQSGESMARYLTGVIPENLPEGALYETRVLKYTERNLNSIQLRGQHHFKRILAADLEWMSSFAQNTQDEPDMRFFSNHLYIENLGDYAETTYVVGRSFGYNLPERYFRDLKEDNSLFDIKLAIPFKQWFSLTGKLKLGANYNEKDRTFRERIFEYQNGNYNLYRYNGDPEEYFDDSNIGIMDSTGGFYRFANYILETTAPRGNYNGNQIIRAFFAMIDLPVTKSLRFTGGVRNENTDIDVVTRDTTLEAGRLRNNDNLPSASFIYQLSENVNIRTAYGRTLARPTFRELAPYASWEFVNGYFFIGNAHLKRTLIDNYDLRWEWFVKPGEIYAISGFYKKFYDPIERVIKNENGEVGYQNVDHGQVIGMEIELRKNLREIHHFLGNFNVGANVTFTRSEVKISEEEMIQIRAADSNAVDTRPLWGQSPYVVNIDVSYDNLKTGSTATISYNTFGKRLTEVSLGATPDVYEMPSPTLNFVLAQKLFYHLGLKFAAKNLLGSSNRKVHEYNGNEYIFQEFERDRSYSLGISFAIK